MGLWRNRPKRVVIVALLSTPPTIQLDLVRGRRRAGVSLDFRQLTVGQGERVVALPVEFRVQVDPGGGGREPVLRGDPCQVRATGT